MTDPGRPAREIGHVSRLLAALLGVAAAFLPTGCGEEGPKVARAAPRVPAARLPPVSAEEKVRFALDRIVNGPLVEGSLKFHEMSLSMAQADLVALPKETLALLSDPGVIQRLTNIRAPNLDPWHAVLDVLTSIPEKPLGLVVAWCEPTIDAPEATLRPRAVACLASMDDPGTGPTLLGLFDHVLSDRNASRAAFRALAALGSPWRERAVVLALGRGVPDLWVAVPDAVGADSELGRLDPGAAGCLAWWALLTETSAPRTGTDAPRIKPAGWAVARVWLDASLPRLRKVGDRLEFDPGPVAMAWSEAAGTISTEPASGACLPVYHLLLTGREPAADARCRLAVERYPAYAASVAADADESRAWDAATHLRAKHCMVGANTVFSAETLAEAFVAFLDEAAKGKAHEPADVVEQAGRLPPATSPRGRALLLRTLRSLRPAPRYRPLLEASFDALAREGVEEALDVVRLLLRDAIAPERGLALHLIHRSRDSAFLADLERAHDGASAEERPSVRRTLWWVYSRTQGIEPAAVVAFAKRYAAWVAEAPDQQVRGMATGLLDLSDAGADEFIKGLGGARGRLYVESLGQSSGLLPLPVAEALIGLVDAATPADLRQTILLIAYAMAPAEAADALAAARERLDPALRPEVDGILESVRHRARR